MVRTGDTITIRPSRQLTENKLAALANKKGTVTKVVKTGNRILGVCADVMMLRKRRNYFIPIKSVEGPDEVRKARVLGMLKTTTL